MENNRLYGCGALSGCISPRWLHNGCFMNVMMTIRKKGARGSSSQPTLSYCHFAHHVSISDVDSDLD